MNHIYRSIWSESLGTWVADSEHTKSKGKPSNTHSTLLATGLLVCSTNSWALPTGEQLVAGQVNINTPNTGQMQIDQTSQQAIVNWQGFSIAPNESVNIQQPNSQAALLNRVVGQDASQIQGQLNANGQVYLVNPNGVVFSKTAQVDVGGLVASTHNIKDADFLNGKNHFTQDNAKGTVSNQGNIKTPDGGVVAFIGNQVSNDGTINTPKGTTALAAGKTVDLDFQGNGLVEVKVSEAALNAQINNKGAIQAEGGRVVLTAKAAGQLIDSVINQDGIIKAQGLVERNGEIILDGGDNGTVNVSGTLDTSSNQGLESNTTGGNIKVTGQQIQIQNTATLNASGNSAGGHITVGNKQTSKQTTIQQGAILNAQVNKQGNAGNIEVLANMTDGTVQLDGELNAAAPKHGNGGFINTSAAHIKISNRAKTTTLAANGKTGTWLIDPVDYTIATSGGDMTGTDLSNRLNSNNIEIAGAGDVNVNDVVNWSANKLTLNAQRNININANLNGSGTAQLALKYGQASANGGTNDDYFINKGVKVNLAAGENFSTQKGTNDANLKAYTVITSLGTLADATSAPTTMTLQGMNTGLAGKYVLGANIDATATGSWDTGAGFMPVGTQGNAFTGQFDGLGHTITGLTINRPVRDYVGLFGFVSGGSISNVGLLGGSIVGQSFVGGLVGENSNSTINNTYATGNVTGSQNVGGLVGENSNSSTINIAYATGSVTGNLTGNLTGSVEGTISVGGLVGHNYNATINNAYATGNVTGAQSVGGLVGDNSNSTINNAYATGNVTGTTTFAGGLVGDNNANAIINNAYATGNVKGNDNKIGGLAGDNSNGTINNAFWDTKNTAQGVGKGTISAKTAGKTTAQMQQLATFSGAGWDIANTGGSSAIWRIYEGNTTPLLRSFLTPFNANISEPYNGLSHNPLNNTVFSILSGAGGEHFFGNAVTVGRYPLAVALYSDQQGYDIGALGSLTITPAALSITANNASKTYGQELNFLGTEFTSSGLQNSETIGAVSLESDGAVTTAAVVGNPYAITVSNATGGSFNANNYSITYNDGALTVNPAALTITANNASKTYGQQINFLGTEFTSSGLQNGETISAVSLFSNGAVATAASRSYLIGVSNAKGETFNANNYNITYNNGVLGIENLPGTSGLLGGVQLKVDQAIAAIIGQANFSTQIEQANPSTLSGKSGAKVAIATVNDVNDFILDEISTASDQIAALVNENKIIIPTLAIKNSAGRVKRLKLSSNKKFLSLLLEDDSVRVWDFEHGTQRNIVDANKNLGLSDVSAVNNDGELISVASPAGIGVYDVIGSLIDDKLAVTEPNVNYFANSNDGQLLLINIDNNYLSLWDNQQHQERWRLPYQRGAVNNLALSDNNHYAAVLSKQQGVYVYEETTGKLKSLTDAVDIIDLNTGKIIKSLPNLGENVIYSRFTDNDTLTLGLASGELSNWSIATGNKKTLVNFSEAMIALDHNQDTYAYLTENNTVRIGNEQGDIQLSIQNKDNPITHAELLADGKKLLTVLDSGDLALWDIATGKKTLRLFSSQQGWTVMDTFGRFDGSDESIENFSWIAKEEEIPLDSFSENYYEPGLLTSILQNEADPINTNRVQEGIYLPPKVDLQLADKQTQNNNVDLTLDVYDRGGGIDKISIFHNGKLLNNQSLLTTQQTQTENKADKHRAFTLNIAPSAGENTLKVLASNAMGIENNSSEIRFDGKTKAYNSAMRLMTVGINNYKESQLQLKYSVADAELIDSAIKNSSKIIASKSLTNEDATKAKILAELKEISQGAEQDVLVIYFAGHGVAVDKEWYFLPYETKLESNVQKIVKAGITATELSEIFKSSKIQHILLMVDSCHSGAGMNAFSTLENGQRYFTRQLGHSLGITVITAAAKNQEASEIKSLGHGLFTYLIAQELQKKNSDQPITAHGIADSITQTLPSFSKKTIGVIQEPVVYTKGNNFMLSDFLKNKK